MGFNIRHLNKYVRWVRQHCSNYKDNCTISKEYAKYCSQLETALLLKKPDSVIDEISMKKHEWVLDYMRKACPITLEKYKNCPVPENIHSLNKDIKVWSMWWQGEENADPLFRMCIESARKHTGQEVITLSKNNYQQYFEIPDYILQKQKEGKIGLAHICDLMVMSIMASEGGFFTGATVWWSQDKDDEFLRTPFFVCKAETQRKYLMSRSRWVGFVMGGNKEFPLFPFVRDCLLEYWKNYDKAVDYLMMDYLFELAYETIPCVMETINAVPDNNLLRNELIYHLSDPFDEKAFEKYTRGDTFLYKLSWKFGDKKIYTDSGVLTNYGHMLEECDIKDE